MPQSIDLANHELLALTRASLAALRRDRRAATVDLGVEDPHRCRGFGVELGVIGINVQIQQVEPGVDVLALGDITAIMGIIQTFLRRVFCFFGCVVVGHGSRAFS